MTNLVKNHQPFNKRDKRFLILFTLVLIIEFLPFTPLGQVSAIFFILGAIFFVGIRPVYHIKVYLLLIVLLGTVSFYYWLIYPDHFWGASYFLFLVTISAFLILFYDFRSIVSEALLKRIGWITMIIIGIEAVYGIFQAGLLFIRIGSFDRSAGDMVWGTLAPPGDWAFRGRMPIFILLLSTLFILSLALTSRKIRLRHLLIYATVALCWLLASLMHSYIYFSLALIISFIILKISAAPRRISESRNNYTVQRTGSIIGLAIVILSFFFIIGPRLLPTNFAKIIPVLSEAFDISPDSKFIKNRVTYQTLFELPKEVSLQPIIGLGPGQYASRAALMLSGEYLERFPIPFINESSNEYTQEYILSQLGKIGSSLHFPTSSWLAWYGELGLLGFLIVIFLVVKGLKVFRSYRSSTFIRMNLFMITLLLYIVMLGFQNVYWEYTQAIFPAVLGLKLSYDYLRKEKTTSI